MLKSKSKRGLIAAKSRHFKTAGHGAQTLGRPKLPEEGKKARRKLANQKYRQNHKDTRRRSRPGRITKASIAVQKKRDEKVLFPELTAPSGEDH